MKLYFGNMVTTVTTIMVIALVGFIGYSVWNRNTISFWGRRNLFLLMYGLVICCFAAARDGLDKTIQAAVDGSCGYGACEDYTVRCICLHKMDMKLYRSAGLRESLA